MKKFDNDVVAIQKRLRDMGELARSMVRLAATAVQDRTRDVSAEIAEAESRLNRMHTDIDHEAIHMLTIFGPVAKDLRSILVFTHVTAKFERMGDRAVNICQSLQLMHSDPATHATMANVRKMADLVCEMVDDAIDAYFAQNVEKAIATRVRDDVVDALNDQVVKDLLTEDVLREVLSGARDIGEAVAQILISRDLERIADQATNICKEVVYMVRGDDVRHIRPPRPPA